jgi:UDP-N-acetylmuramate dehydrogenase
MVGAPVALSAYTTLGLGGPADRFVAAGTDEQIVAAVREADLAGQPILVLGGGSNLVVADEGFPGTVIRIASRGISLADGPGSALVTAAAGEVWDELVAWSVAQGLAGIECLSGIPGLVGATPIQNVGAYGQDVAQTICEVRALDREGGEVVRLTAQDCEFGYRTSRLKRTAAGRATGRFVVLEVTFRLRRSGADRGTGGAGHGAGAAEPGPEALSEPIKYAELARKLGVAVGERVPLGQVRPAVLELRRGKGMVLDAGDPDSRSAGSFFTNPVLTAEQFAELERLAASRWGAETPVPHYPAEDGSDGPDGAGGGAGAVKVPAGWLIERAGFTKGYPRDGAARISSKHTLALTNPGGARTTDVLALAEEIRAGVREAFGVSLVNEPVIVGVAF